MRTVTPGISRSSSWVSIRQRPVADVHPGGERRTVPVGRGVVGDDDDPLGALGEDLGRHVLGQQAAGDGLAAGHRDAWRWSSGPGPGPPSSQVMNFILGLGGARRRVGTPTDRRRLAFLDGWPTTASHGRAGCRRSVELQNVIRAIMWGIGAIGLTGQANVGPDPSSGLKSASCPARPHRPPLRVTPMSSGPDRGPPCDQDPDRGPIGGVLLLHSGRCRGQPACACPRRARGGRP